jgi:hypothetical protein
MVVFSYVVGVLLLTLILLRQIRVVPVRRAYAPRLPLVLGVIGLFTMSSYAGNHHVTSSAWSWVIGTLVVGAIGLGALRGLSMRVWDTNGWVVRQGNVVTMALWLISLLVHFAVDAGDHARTGAAGLVGASFLLYLGLTLAVQQYVVFRRAQPLWARLGPNAGRPLTVNFSQGPGAFFATFGGGVPGPGGQPGWGAGATATYDPDVIDVDVVEDDDDHGPPELHAPR